MCQMEFHFKVMVFQISTFLQSDTTAARMSAVLKGDLASADRSNLYTTSFNPLTLKSTLIKLRLPGSVDN